MVLVDPGVRWSPSRVVLATFTLSLLLCSTGGAQDEHLEPSVNIETEAFPDWAVPHGAPVQTVLSASIGCDALETPESTTTVTVESPDLPGFVDLTLSPNVHTWTTNETQCSPLEEDDPVEISTLVHLRVIENVPGFEVHTLPLDITVAKQDPQEAFDPRTYGPYETEVTFETGFANRFEVRADERVVAAAIGEAATFQGEIENMGNHPTRFALSVDAPSEIVVEGAQDDLVIEPGETRSWSLEVALADPEPPLGMISFTLVAESSAEHASKLEGRTDELDLMVEFQGETRGQGTPGFVPVIVLAVLGFAAVTHRGHPR